MFIRVGTALSADWMRPSRGASIAPIHDDGNSIEDLELEAANIGLLLSDLSARKNWWILLRLPH